MKDLGESCTILGINIIRDRLFFSVVLSQQRYVQNIVERFGLSAVKGASPSLEVAVYLSLLTGSICTARYPDALGVLMFLMIGTHSDIAYAVFSVAIDVRNPSISPWKCVQQVFRYFPNTVIYGLQYEGSKRQLNIYVFFDADQAGDTSTRKSVSGCTIMTGRAVVSWCA